MTEQTTIPYGKDLSPNYYSNVTTYSGLYANIDPPKIDIINDKKRKLPRWLSIMTSLLGVYSAIIIAISFVFLQPVTAFLLSIMSILGIVVISLLVVAVRIKLNNS